MKLLVRNLATTTTEEELLAMFKSEGAVQSCNLVLDKKTGESKGFGFVEMPYSGDAKAAVKNLNGIEVKGNKIRVKKDDSKKEKITAKQSNNSKTSVKDTNIKTSNKDPLHGITLETMLTRLQKKYGWEELARRIKINCFTHDPSIKSSLNFLRRTAWARKKVEALFLDTKWPANTD